MPPEPSLSAGVCQDAAARRESNFEKLRKRMRVNGRDTAMSDDMQGNMMQESDDHAELLFKPEKQAEALKEIAVFEEQVDRRQEFLAKNVYNCYTMVVAQLCGLEAHAEPPRIFSDSPIRSTVNVKMRSRPGQHREK